eukprot:6186018-Pleurochrysis_carterae.AAC.1
METGLSFSQERTRRKKTGSGSVPSRTASQHRSDERKRSYECRYLSTSAPHLLQILAGALFIARQPVLGALISHRRSNLAVARRSSAADLSRSRSTF